MKEHFVIEQITFERNALSSKNGKGKCGALKMHVWVGWCVKWNSLWSYTTLPSYRCTEWMISMIVAVRLWRLCNIVQIRPDLIMSLNICHLQRELSAYEPFVKIVLFFTSLLTANNYLHWTPQSKINNSKINSYTYKQAFYNFKDFKNSAFIFFLYLFISRIE